MIDVILGDVVQHFCEDLTTLLLGRRLGDLEYLNDLKALCLAVSSEQLHL